MLSQKEQDLFDHAMDKFTQDPEVGYDFGYDCILRDDVIKASINQEVKEELLSFVIDGKDITEISKKIKKLYELKAQEICLEYVQDYFFEKEIEENGF